MSTERYERTREQPRSTRTVYTTRRPRTAWVDLLAALAIALVVLIISPGLAISGVIALLALIGVIVWGRTSRRRTRDGERRRRRREREARAAGR